MDTADLQASMEQLYGRLQLIQQANEALQVEVQQLRAAPPQPLPTPRLSEPKMALPEKFDGDRHKLRGFLNQLELLFNLNPSKYPTDHIKVSFVGTLLTGKALAYFNPIIEKPAIYGYLLNNWDNFKENLQQAFGDPDRTYIAETRIRNLKQNNQPASSYAAEFRSLASDIDWNQAALISQFKQGLKSEVKDMLLHHDHPTHLEGFINLAIKCDNRLFEHQQEKKHSSINNIHHFNKPKSPQPYKPSQPAQPKQPEAMQIDAVRHQGKLTEAEKQRRKDQGLCLYCGGNHLRVNCPLAPKTKPWTQNHQLQINDPDSQPKNAPSH
jgi:hypothetical protein